MSDLLDEVPVRARHDFLVDLDHDALLAVVTSLDVAARGLVFAPEENDPSVVTAWRGHPGSLVSMGLWAGLTYADKFGQGASEQTTWMKTRQYLVLATPEENTSYDLPVWWNPTAPAQQMRELAEPDERLGTMMREFADQQKVAAKPASASEWGLTCVCPSSYFKVTVTGAGRRWYVCAKCERPRLADLRVQAAGDTHTFPGMGLKTSKYTTEKLLDPKTAKSADYERILACSVTRIDSVGGNEANGLFASVVSDASKITANYTWQEIG